MKKTARSIIVRITKPHPHAGKIGIVAANERGMVEAVTVHGKQMVRVDFEDGTGGCYAGYDVLVKN